jgi:hypothetical protein
MMLWRLHIRRGLIQWHGPLRTYTLWPWKVQDRGNL